MKVVTLNSSILPALILVVNFLNMGPMPGGMAAKRIVAKSDKNVGYALWQTTAQRKQPMSNSISTLLTRNLIDVFGENDPARRRTAINEIFTADCVFYEPHGGVYRGRDEIDRIAGSLRTAHADFRYQPIAEPEEVGDGGRIRWVEGRPGQAPAVAGTDFIIARDGRIAAIYLFFDKLP